MKYMIFATALLFLPPAARADQGMVSHGPSMSHAVHGAAMETAREAMPSEAGQSAFAAIQEIVAMLDADPRTDWSKVDIEALRRHLVDMSNVTLKAHAETERIAGGARFAVTGKGAVVGSIRRMVAAHAATMNGHGGWTYAVAEITDGAALTVTVGDPADVAKVRALGFIGVMAHGAHHQMHHWMIATGRSPHQ